jgi:hypothetical protein
MQDLQTRILEEWQTQESRHVLFRGAGFLVAVLSDGLHDYTEQRIRGSIREKDKIETKGVMVSKGNWASQTDESPHNPFCG